MEIFFFFWVGFHGLICKFFGMKGGNNIFWENFKLSLCIYIYYDFIKKKKRKMRGVGGGGGAPNLGACQLPIAKVYRLSYRWKNIPLKMLSPKVALKVLGFCILAANRTSFFNPLMKH